MAEFTYESRKKISETWVYGLREKGTHLSGHEKKLLPEIYGTIIPSEVCIYMRKLLENGTYRTLSGLYKGEFSGAVKLCVPDGCREEFYEALDGTGEACALKVISLLRSRVSGF